MVLPFTMIFARHWQVKRSSWQQSQVCSYWMMITYTEKCRWVARKQWLGSLWGGVVAFPAMPPPLEALVHARYKALVESSSWHISSNSHNTIPVQIFVKQFSAPWILDSLKGPPKQCLRYIKQPHLRLFQFHGKEIKSLTKLNTWKQVPDEQIKPLERLSWHIGIGMQRSKCYARMTNWHQVWWHHTCQNIVWCNIKKRQQLVVVTSMNQTGICSRIIKIATRWAQKGSECCPCPWHPSFSSCRWLNWQNANGIFSY